MAPSMLPSALLLASLFVLGCSGKTDVVGSGDGGSGSSSGGGSSGGGGSCFDDPPRCGTSSSDAGQADAQVCVNIDLATYDRSCQTSTDCVGIASGPICNGDCACGGSTINLDGEARYNAALSGVTLGVCPCVAGGIPTCIQNVCTLCGLGNQPPCPDGG